MQRPPEPSKPPKARPAEDEMEDVPVDDPITALADAVRGKATGAKAGLPNRSPDADTVLWVLQCLQSGYQLVPGGLGVETLKLVLFL